MAVAVKPSKSLLNIRSGIKSIKDSFSGLRKNSENLNEVMLKKTKVKRESIARNYILSQRRQEQERRKNKEDLLEASSIGGAIKRQGRAIASSTKGFLGRIMDFLSTLLVGWLLTNLPSIITMAQELIARIQRLYTIVTGFFNNTVNLFKGFGKLLSAVGKNILTFDFTDSKGRVATALTDLGGTFDDMQSQFDEGFKLLTTSLGEGVVSGENAKPFGTQYENESMQEQPSGGTSGSGGKWKPLLDLISSVESSTDKKNNGYDAQNGAPRGVRPGLSQMTIGEIARNAPGASGRYQQMPQFLLGRAKAAGYNENTIFSPAVQDVLAIKLIEGRGGNLWLSGKMKTEDFMQGLADEWAALPNAYGKFSYSGQSSSLKSEKVKSVLQQVKSVSSQSQTPSQPSTPRPAQTSPSPSTPVPNQSMLPKLPPTDTLGGGVQRYGASRRGGRRHAGTDFDISGNQKFYSRIGGVVTKIGYDPGGYGNYVDIYNAKLGVYERIAEAAKILVREGQTIQPGQAVVQGEGPTGVIHYEIRKNSGYGFSGTINPLEFLSSVKPQAQIASSGTQQRRQASQQLAQQPAGPSIIIIEEDPPAPQPQVSVGGGGAMMIPIVINPLNSFITKKLLLDLAYT
jgi:murein DD-endopeptidase MepM/ murein hydrolase activator NlpD